MAVTTTPEPLIEDAVALADAPSAAPDVPAGLTGYVEARRDRTARVQSAARDWGEIWHVDGVSRLLRNELMRALDPAEHGPRYVDWLFGPPQR
jgi:salicylate hydroxylase